jgi:type I restriction enzyme S subunit
VYGQEQVIADDFGIGDYFIDEARYQKLRTCDVRPGDVLVSLVGTFGRSSVVPAGSAPGIINPRLVRLALHERVADPWYIKQVLASPVVQRHFEGVAHGGTMGVLNAGSLSELELPVPPLNEQRRIVAKLDALTERSRRAKAALDAIPALIEKFKQSVLAAAFRGDLTADWRAAHPDVEPASELLKRIRVERRRRWEEAELAKLTAKGKAPTDDRWKARYEEPEAVDASELPELPRSWCWARLGELGRGGLDAVQTGPFGAQLHNTEFTEAGVPVIAVGNLTGTGFSDQDLYFVSPEKAQQLSRYDVWAGDVLFARSGATLGKVCVAPTHVKDWRMTGHILRVRLENSVLLSEIAVLALWGAPSVKAQVESGIRGATRPGYNTTLLENILVPLMPMLEQHQVTARSIALIARLDSVGNENAEHQARLSSLDRSILAKAFRGELVPQDPSDEPASVLLERIRAERAAADGADGAANGKPGRRRRAAPA